MKSFFTTVFITLFAITGVIAQSDKDSKKTEKITAEELLAKHVASIGTPEALAAARTRVIVGEGGVRALKGYSGSLVGPVQLASDSERMLFVMLFNSNEYPYEKALDPACSGAFGSTVAADRGGDIATQPAS